MLISAWRKRLAFSRLLEPQTLLDALSDMNQCYAWDWLGLKQSPSVFFTDGENQFKVLSIAQGVIQRRAVILHKFSVIADRNPIGVEDGAAAALDAYVVDVGGQSVANVDHGMKGHGAVKLDSFVNARLEVEMFAADAVAQAAAQR